MFFDIIKPRKMEHLQREEPFSSDPYFSIDWYSDVKSFSRSFENSEKEQFFFTVDQSNFRNKIPFVFTMTILFRDVYKIKCFCDVIMLGSEILTGIYKLCS